MNKVIRKALCLILTLAFFMGTVSEVSAKSYNDVSQNDWYYNSVEYVTNIGLMNGTENSTFLPEKNVSRGMLITILYRLEGSPSVAPSTVFFDVSSDEYYGNAISWAIQNNLVSGISNDQFSPDSPITKEQMATVFYRYAKVKGYDTSITKTLDQFSDSGKVSNYATKAMQWMVGNKIIQGSNNKLNPSDIATRAQVSAMIVRFIENVSALEKVETPEQNSNIGKKITAIVNNKVFSVTLEDNDTTKSFMKLLPLTLDMSELDGNEKYYYLPYNLRSDSAVQPEIIHNGDIMLYGENCMVLFYKTFNTSYSYVKIGHIDDPIGLESTLGKSGVQIKFSVLK